MRNFDWLFGGFLDVMDVTCAALMAWYFAIKKNACRGSIRRT